MSKQGVAGEQPTEPGPTEKPELKAEKSKRSREEKIRKKDEKSVEHMLKALSNLSTPEEKLAVMYQKYTEIINNQRVLQNTVKVMEKKTCVLQREKEQLQAEHNKAILTRSRLENLCRELQRQNKAIKDESLTAMREEEEKKREVAAMFHSTLTELGNLVSKNNDKNNKLRDDNIDMSNKLKSVCEQYEKKEQHVEKLGKQLELEMQLTEAKMAKAKMEMAIEKDTLNREKQQLLLECAKYKGILEENKETETNLRNQIHMYNEKYDEFHKALVQSNEAISSFKQEMERMSKQITKLEKETMTWRTRYESTHQALLKMTDEKLQSDQNTVVTLKRMSALQGLCRKLQGECALLRDELKKQGINPGDIGKMKNGEDSKPDAQDDLTENCSIQEKKDDDKTCKIDDETSKIDGVTTEMKSEKEEKPENVEPESTESKQSTIETNETADLPKNDVGDAKMAEHGKKKQKKKNRK